jgi:hypothetical protein
VVYGCGGLALNENNRKKQTRMIYGKFFFFVIGYSIITISGLVTVFYILIRWKSLERYKPKYIRLYGLIMGLIFIFSGLVQLKILLGVGKP